MYIYFFYCCNKIPWQQNLRDEGFISYHFKGADHREREGMVAGV